MTRVVLLFILIGVYAGCKQASSPQEASADPIEALPVYQEVMAIHDAVMPEMTTLHQLKKELQALKTDQNKDEIVHITGRIERADEQMMAWMNALDIPEEKEQAEPYLTEQKLLMQAVADSFQVVIQDARQVAAKYKKN